MSKGLLPVGYQRSGAGHARRGTGANQYRQAPYKNKQSFGDGWSDKVIHGAATHLSSTARRAVSLPHRLGSMEVDTW